MRISLKGTLRAGVCIFAPLVLPLQSLAQDDTNAANVDAVTWGYMYQVMAGTSTKTPNSLNILTPQGLYVISNAEYLSTQAMDVEGVTGVKVSTDEALTNYFSFLLSQPGVAGLLYTAPWKFLNPDPGVYKFASLIDAINAVNAAHKTLQLLVTPGSHSPEWLFKSPYLSSCDFLFTTSSGVTANPSCGYTNVFSTTLNPGPFPLPWNKTYQTQWETFLEKLEGQISGQTSVVSIAVAGPTYLSEEMILPRSLPDGVPSGYNTGITALSAWNCLLANNYGATPTSGASYLNSDRAFIEQWAAAIDMYGGIFSGITLTVSTGNGLPDFSSESAGPVPGCGLSSVSAPAPATFTSLPPPPAFMPDCDVSPKPPFPMDCAAETAILAYFAEPSVGGPNAKATQEDALTASDDVVPTLLTLSNASVKWLSQLTTHGLAAVPDNPNTPGSMPVMSRMLGGLQFSKAASVNAAIEGCPLLQCEGCLELKTVTVGGRSLSVPTCVMAPPTCAPANQCALPAQIPYCATTYGSQLDCKLLSPPSNAAPVEQALLNALQVYFAGTSATATRVFAAPTMLPNTTAPVSGAPMDYLQVWLADIDYAAGYGNCPIQDLMTNPLTTCSFYIPPATMPKVCISETECGINAQGLLSAAAANIPTTPVALPLFGYNNGSNQVCGCQTPYYTQRMAFSGDLVCVSPGDAAAAAVENSTYVANYSKNESNEGVPYGPCQEGFVWRQAYMGDYICVPLNPQATTVAADNVAGATHIECPAPAP